MRQSANILLLTICLFILCSFNPEDRATNDKFDIEKYERLALRNNKAGKEYIIDLTGVEGCNKSRVRYLGVVTTTMGRKYKVLTSFYVHGDNCRGTSNIKIYDVNDKFIGRYYVGMPYDLPDTLIKNKLFYSKNQQDCSLRQGTSINMSNGLPKKFFIPCSKTGGDEYTFSE